MLRCVTYAKRDTLVFAPLPRKQKNTSLRTSYFIHENHYAEIRKRAMTRCTIPMKSVCIYVHCLLKNRLNDNTMLLITPLSIKQVRNEWSVTNYTLQHCQDASTVMTTVNNISTRSG